MAKTQMVSREQAIGLFRLLQDHYLADRKDIPEGVVFRELIERRGREIVDILETGMPMPNEGEIYSSMKDKGIRNAVQWAYYPVQSNIAVLPEQGFVRISPRRLIHNPSLLTAHQKQAKEMEYRPHARVFSADKLIKDLVGNRANEDLVVLLNSTGKYSLLCHCESWHYVPSPGPDPSKPEESHYLIASQAILATGELVKPSNLTAGELQNWERGTQRFWARKKTNEKISALIHSPRKELLMSGDQFYAVADKYPIIQPPSE